MSTPQQLDEMLSVLGDDALRDAFARPDAFGNPETKEILDSVLYPWLFDHTRAEGTAAAQAAGWPFAGVNSPAEVLEADHLHQRGFWTEGDDPTIGPVLLPGPPYRHAEGGWQRHHPAPVAPTSGDGATAVRRRAGPAGAPARLTHPGEAAPRGSGVRAGAHDRSGGGAAARCPGPRLHHGVVRSLRHPAAGRSRRRGD